MVRKKFSESSVLFIILGSLILLGFVAYIQDPLLVYFNPENYEDEQSYREYTEVLEGDEDFGGDDIGGGEVDDDYGGEASNMIDILENNAHICFVSDKCLDDEANSITGHVIQIGKKPFRDIDHFRKVCPIFQVKFRTTPLDNAFDCSDYALAAQLCAAYNGYGLVCQLVEPATRKYNHALNIVEVELKEDNEKEKNIHRFCTADQSHDWFTNNEGWRAFQSCCWNQKGKIPKKELSNRCIKPGSKIYCANRRTSGGNDPCFITKKKLCEELSDKTGIPLKCIKEWAKLPFEIY